MIVDGAALPPVMLSPESRELPQDIVELSITSESARAARWKPRLTSVSTHEHSGLVQRVDLDLRGCGTRRSARELSKCAGRAQNPIHFDLTSTCGAEPADVGQTGDEGHVVLADPEGNEFCVIEPGNRFSASCPRLGPSTATGRRTLATSSAPRSAGRLSGIKTKRPQSKRM